MLQVRRFRKENEFIGDAIYDETRPLPKRITIADPAGMMMVPDLYLSADASSYIYGFSRMLSTLYVVTGLK